MKKLITTILVVAMIFTMCGTAMAAGEKVIVPVKIAETNTTPAINITYSGEGSLTLLKVQLDSELPIASISSNYDYTYNPHNGMLLISCYETSGEIEDNTVTFSGQGDGTDLFTINYTIASTVVNDSYGIDITVLEARNAAEEIISVAALDGSLEIGTMILGDVDGDGIVSNADLVMVAQYKVGLITLTREELVRADIDGDGLVTNADIVIISQMIVS